MHVTCTSASVHEKTMQVWLNWKEEEYRYMYIPSNVHMQLESISNQAYNDIIQHYTYMKATE